LIRRLPESRVKHGVSDPHIIRLGSPKIGDDFAHFDRLSSTYSLIALGLIWDVWITLQDKGGTSRHNRQAINKRNASRFHRLPVEGEDSGIEGVCVFKGQGVTAT
jgi:hypothetical protein